MDNSDKISIIMVDDHAVVRQGLRAFLQSKADMEVIGEASNGEEAIQLAVDLAPDVALVDLIIPGMDGVEITRRIRSASPRTQVVIFSSFHDDEHIFPALRAGALSYQLKEAPPEVLEEAIRKAARGEAVLHPKVAAQLVHEIQGETRTKVNPFTELSERELEVLNLIAKGSNNHEIADQLVISEKTVKSHVSNILSKLHLADRTQAAVFAWKEGIMRRDRD
ncbi:MAG: response regulator transcription factor [Anaerolineales bacterium]|nr:response regulator transcription factor [Anaerolineales bacterium]